MKSFNKTNLNILRYEIKNALKRVENDNGIEIDLGSMRFSDHVFTSKIEVSTVIADSPNSKATHRLKTHGYKFGLTEDHYGKKIITPTGATYKIIGCASRHCSLGIVAETDTGKLVRLATASLKYLKK